MAGSVIDCMEPDRTSVYQGINKEFTNIDPLVIGDVYYFSLGSIGVTLCSTTIRITAGNTTIPELTAINLTGPDNPCVGNRSTYTTTTVIDNTISLTRYAFLLEGDTLSYGQQDTLDVTWNLPGRYNLCVTANNPCSEPVTDCRIVTVNDPERQDSTVYLCPDECFSFSANDEACTPGSYPRNRTDTAGCTFTTHYNVVAIVPDTTRLFAAICSGDSLTYRGLTYTVPGIYDQILTGRRGCDSVVLITLSFVACTLETSLSATSPICHDSADGSLTFMARSGAPPFTYSATLLSGNLSLQGVIASLNMPVILGGLESGTYIIDISDDFGSTGVLTTEIVSPAPLEVSSRPSVYGAFTNRCPDSNDGTITLSPSGGTPPYVTIWSDTSLTTPFRNDLSPGRYFYTVMDATGCPESESILLSAPPPLSLIARSANEFCDSAATGRISTLNASGGTSPYQYNLEDENMLISPPYENLSAGQYLLTAIDDNGCEADTVLRITRPGRPSLFISSASMVLELGESVDLEARGTNLSEIRWSGPGDFSCDTCLTTTSSPLHSANLTARAVSTDGCVARDSVYITVAASYDDYFPNAFSPNADGVNDVFFPNAGPTSERLLWMRIYDRWGGGVFQCQNLNLPMSPADGWDGTARGKTAVTGVYVWSAAIQHIDGHISQLSGVVNLLR